MKPAFLFGATAALLLSASAASARSFLPANDDTIVVKMPNQVSMTIVAKDKKQLRELRAYKLDSLMLLLGTYIDQAEAAGRRTGNGQVTMEFYPAKDQPGSKAAPEQVRVTVRGVAATTKTEVMMGKVGINIEKTGDGKDENVTLKISDSPKADSLRRVKQEQRRHRLVGSDLSLDVGLNALTQTKPYVVDGVTQPFELRPLGSRYVSINWDFWARTGRNSPLYFHLGPEFAFNNYMLEGNRQFRDTNGRTIITTPADIQLEKSKLATTALNLPAGFTLRFTKPVINDEGKTRNKEVFRIGLGGFVGTRLSSHTKIKYTTEGRTTKDKDRGSYNLEDFQYGVTGTVGIYGVNFFAKYNLNDLFKNGRGPQANVVSFGITLMDL